MYVLRRGDVYVSFVLHAVSRYALVADPGMIRPLKADDIELFERVMPTVEFE